MGTQFAVRIVDDDRKGFIIDIQEEGFDWYAGRDKAFFNQNWGLVTVSDQDFDAVVKKYREPWYMHLNFTTLNYSAAQDGYRIKVEADSAYISTQGVGKLTKAQIEDFLTAWGATIFAFGDNYVTFDLGMYNMLQTDNFWKNKADISQVDFTELSYNETTHTHQIQAEYPVNWGWKKVEDIVKSRGATIQSHDKIQGIILFNIICDGLLRKIKKHIIKQREISKLIKKRIYYFDSTDVQTLIDNDYEMTITKAQFLNKVKSYLDD